MNKSQLTEELAARLGIRHSEAESFLNVLINLIYQKVAMDEKVNIWGFGEFSRSHRLPRMGVNPRTLEKITIPEHYTPRFKAGDGFKQAVKLQK